MEAGVVWENSVLSAQFCSEPKTALKNSLSFFGHLMWLVGS